MKNPWIRLYREALHNPKVVTLNDRQHRAWHNCMLMSDDAGKLPKWRDMACHMRMTVQEAEQVVCELVEAGLVDIEGFGADRVFKLHDWATHQYISDSSAERTKKYRENIRKKGSDGGVTSQDRHGDGGVTPPESYSDTDTESNGLPSFPTAARKRAKEDPKGLKNVFGMKDDKKERLHRRAEGLGLNVEELVKACHSHKAKNLPAYFTTLCVQQLQSKLKDLKEPAIRAALWDADDGPDSAYQTINRLLVGAA